MDSTDDNLDIELLAALIDGRLSGAERERALRMLATSDEALELFAHSLHEQRAAEVQVVPIRSAPRWRSWRVVVPVAAAAALVLVMLPKLVGSSARTVSANEYAMRLVSAPRFSASLRSGWDQHDASVNRGANDNRVAPEPRFAFRLGARTVDVQVALRVGDTSLASRLIDDIHQTLDGIKFTEAVAAKYTDLKSHLATNSAAQSIESAANAEHDMSQLFASSPFRLGQWAAAADLAAQAHDMSFFRSKDGTKLARSTMPAGDLDADDSRDLQAIDARLAQGSDDAAFDDVHAILQRLIRRRSN